MDTIHENDDLWSAIRENPLKTFTQEQIKDIVAEVPGENDEYHWWWILKLGTRQYALLSGWCDYTGWDCQSGITEHGIFSTPLLAAKAAPETEEWAKRNIQKNLVNQVTGKQPKFTYSAEW